MQRVTVTLDDDLAAEIDRVVAARGYQSRSEAIRDLTRTGLYQAEQDREPRAGACVAALVYVYQPDVRDLARRLTDIFHEHHDLTISTLHVHLDHDSCMEITVLRGAAAAVGQLGDRVVAERGVLYGRLVMVPVDVEEAVHGHGAAAPRRHAHTHVRRA